MSGQPVSRRSPLNDGVTAEPQWIRNQFLSGGRTEPSLTLLVNTDFEFSFEVFAFVILLELL